MAEDKGENNQDSAIQPPEPKGELGIRAQDVPAQIEQQNRPRLILSLVKPGDVIDIAAEISKPDGTLEIQNYMFLVTKPAMPKTDFPRSFQPAQVELVPEGSATNSSPNKKYFIAGSSFGSMLFTSTIIQDAILELHEPDRNINNSQIGPDLALSVRGFQVRRDVGQGYQTFTPEDLNTFEPSGNIERFQRAKRFFDGIMDRVPPPESGSQYFRNSLPTGEVVNMRKTFNGNGDTITIADPNQGMSYQVEQIPGVSAQEIIYNIDVYAGIEAEAYKNASWEMHALPSSNPYRLRYGYNVSNGALDNSATISLERSDLEPTDLEHVRVNYNPDGTTELIDPLMKPEAHGERDVFTGIRHAKTIAKEFVIPRTTDDAYTVECGNKKIAIPTTVPLDEMRVIASRVLGSHVK